MDRGRQYQYHNNVKPYCHFNATDLESTSNEWFTPPKVFDALQVEFDTVIGEKGRTALHNAVAAGFGKLFGLTAA